MAEATTFGATVIALESLDGKAQLCEADGNTCAGGLREMTSSQAALDNALSKFRLDSRTLGASKAMQEATAAMETKVTAAVGAARALSEATKAALEFVGGHRRLAQAVQEHGEAADMGFYRNGR